MREKAEQGIYPSRPPLGYRNNKLEHTIEADPNKAPVARRIFELYASGNIHFKGLEGLKSNLGRSFPTAMSRMLKNPFYIGEVLLGRNLYPGTHEPLSAGPVRSSTGRVSRA